MAKDIEKYDTKVRIFLKFIADSMSKTEKVKPGKIEEASANIQI